MNVKEEFKKFQSWLVEHRDNYARLLSEKPYCIEVKYDTVFDRNLALFKYSQIDSDFSQPFVKLCRGLILDADTFDIVSFPFVKFHNYGEAHADEIDWNSCYVTEKLDGCVSFDTIVKTTIGDITIKELCDNPDKYEVLTFNHQTNTIEANKVDAIDIKPNIDNWYELELENGVKLNVTGNHKIWCENLQCYRRVDELDGSEDLVFI